MSIKDNTSYFLSYACTSFKDSAEELDIQKLLYVDMADIVVMVEFGVMP